MDFVHTELTELIAWARASNFTYWRKMIAQLFWLQGVHQTPDTLHTISSLISVLHMQPNTTKCLTLSTIVSNYTNTLYAAFADHLQLENAQIDPSHKISLLAKQADARTRQLFTALKLSDTTRRVILASPQSADLTSYWCLRLYSHDNHLPKTPKFLPTILLKN
jgi:hypothetical protein